ncbi:MAG: hypothetical protein AMS27_14145 [Bacteroides sp. SM23_62_1]|nr:MAG: hypothetical protein AMS27_14145 [Bacteroides sp. SM23_62_1]
MNNKLKKLNFYYLAHRYFNVFVINGWGEFLMIQSFIVTGSLAKLYPVVKDFSNDPVTINDWITGEAVSCNEVFFFLEG